MPKVELNYTPLPSQQYLHKSPAVFKAYFGGFGSGKSKWLIYESVFESLERPNNRGLIIRRTMPELKGTIYKDFMEEIPRTLFADESKTDLVYTFHNGSTIQFISFDSLSKIASYNIGFFAIDQAEEFPEAYFLALLTRIRKAGQTPKGFLALNPSGHNWVWKMFIRDNKDRSNPELDYVVAETYENTYLPEGYIERLEKYLPEAWRKRYMNSEFNEFEGLVFDSYDYNRHDITELDIDLEKPQTYEPFNHIHFIVAIDVGVNAPIAVLFSYFDLLNRKLVLFDEIYETGLSISQASYLIKRRIERHKIKKVWQYLIDPDSKKRQQSATDKTGKIKTVMNEFRLNGIPVNQANNCLDYSILKVNEMFKEDKIFVLSSLIHTKDELDSYIWDTPTKVLNEGINSPGRPLDKKNHLMSDLRYTVMSLPSHWINDDVELHNREYTSFVENRFRRKRSLTARGSSMFVGEKKRWVKKIGIRRAGNPQDFR